MSNIKLTLNLFCVVFTMVTLASIAFNLPFGRTTDTYSHIFNRAVLCLLGASLVTLIRGVKFKYKILDFLVPYIIFMPLALFYVFLTSFWEEVHPNAYRDLFLNDTFIYILIFVFVKWYDKKFRSHE